MDKQIDNNSLIDFQNSIHEWASSTFPGQSVESKIKHLKTEILELEAAPSDGEEMADCFILLASIASEANINLAEVSWAKLEKNKTRVWSEPDADGIRRHLDTDSSTA